MKKIGIIIFCLIIVTTLLGQNKRNKHEGILHIALVNPDTLINEKEVGKLHTAYIYHKDELIKIINLDSLLDLPSYYNIIKYSIMFPKNTYSVIIEGCFDYPIIVTDVIIRKGLSHFLELDFKELAKIKVLNPKVLVIDYKRNLDKGLEKLYPSHRPATP